MITTHEDIKYNLHINPEGWPLIAGASFARLTIRRIPFNEIVDFWRAQNHFKNPDKVYAEVLAHLGPFVRAVDSPRRISYGLYHQDEMIGATHVTEWTAEWIRMRTLNIIPQFRGQDLGWNFLSSILTEDWHDRPWLFGWFRNTAHHWADAHGFQEFDGQWHDQHIAMLRKLN